MYIYIYMHIWMHTHTHTIVYIYIYNNIYILYRYIPKTILDIFFIHHIFIASAWSSAARRGSRHKSGSVPPTTPPWSWQPLGTSIGVGLGHGATDWAPKDEEFTRWGSWWQMVISRKTWTNEYGDFTWFHQERAERTWLASTGSVIWYCILHHDGLRGQFSTTSTAL